MNIEAAHQRLLEARDYLKSQGVDVKQYEIAEAMGVPGSHVSVAFKGDPRRLTEGFLRRFAEAYARYISPAWLIDGSGPMTLPDPDETRPHFDIHAAAGLSEVCFEEVRADDIEHRPIIHYLPRYDFTLLVFGDSMEPELHHGDTIACRRITSPAELHRGRIYVIATDDSTLVKAVELNGHTLRLISLNPDYPDTAIPAATVRTLAEVVGLVRRYYPADPLA